MKPVRVIIAEEMDYIAVFSESNNSTIIHNYTINARFIREVTFPFIAADAIAYINPSYTDIIAVLTTDRYLIWIDAFTLEITKRFKYQYEFCSR